VGERPKISTIYPTEIFSEMGGIKPPFPLKIKFLDKIYNAYFSIKFQN
jgi:hypothetical protein